MLERKLTITVMMGGPSAEREVSLRSGLGVAAALRSRGHRVHELDPAEPGWVLPEGTDVVFLALHGAYGEDGTVQAELEKLGVPYTGCGPEASRVGFNKILSKQRFVAAGVPTPRYMVIERPEAAWPVGWEPPLIVKPARQGSSLGLQLVEDRADWPRALAEAWRYDTCLLVEEKVTGRECTVGLLGDQILPISEVRLKQGLYDYHTKYTPGAAEYLCPAPWDEITAERIRTAARAAFDAIGGRDYGRVDIIVRPDGLPVVLEVNTLPGMTPTSALPRAARAAGITYEDLCERMIALAWQRSGKSAGTGRTSREPLRC
ncbi:MAG: D-alanine--D-alanine ligase [Verrucomicrobiota bacterium]|nr:D-alanine--D-alanine ligase [Limisphaera sp.]MDW8381692.1 D-alanine--D-alanine ligase [Verrucomicrobiota bacterium]